MRIKNLIRKTAVGALASVMLISGTAAYASAAAGDMKISLGADLTSEQRATVLSLLNLTEDDLANNDVIYVTNAEEHEYLDEYVDADKIGDTALSSSKIILKNAGEGITVTTYNINYCTVGMYENALLTAGVEDADVYVAGPDKISGTAALIGVMKAYDEATGESLNEENVEAATEELAITSEVAQSLANSENAEKIIAELKTQLDVIADQDDATIDQMIRDTAAEYNETLSDDAVASIRELLKSLSQLDLDELLAKANEFFSNIGKIAENTGEANNILNNIGSFFTNIFNTIANWFKSLF